MIWLGKTGRKVRFAFARTVCSLLANLPKKRRNRFDTVARIGGTVPPAILPAAALGGNLASFVASIPTLFEAGELYSISHSAYRAASSWKPDRRRVLPVSTESSRDLSPLYSRHQELLPRVLDLLKVGDTLHWELVVPEVLHRFVTIEGRTCCRTTLQRKCTVLRNFLTYLYQQGVVASDFSTVVMSPRVYKHEQCPRFLTAEEVDKVLAMVPRATIRGKRHYAMLLLSVVYGLRGIEVTRLKLDDIDWRRQQLHIRRRKAGNSTVYPLTVAVGEAIMAYLRDARPQSRYREVFLSSRSPILPLKTTSALGRPLRAFIAKSGVHVDRPGTHTFRYSCAQRLMDRGMPLKVVGDFLGHRDPGSTQRYTKIAIDQLRQVALGEDLL